MKCSPKYRTKNLGMVYTILGSLCSAGIRLLIRPRKIPGAAFKKACLYVIMYYVYMYVVFIVINVCKLLHVKRPTSSPRAVWNPCKINKALN